MKINSYLQFTIILLSIFISINGFSQNNEQGKIVYKEDKWIVYQRINTMTDQAECLGSLIEPSQLVVLKKDLFLIPVRYGVATVNYRLDDSPAKGVMSATGSSAGSTGVIFHGAALTELLESKRIRTEGGDKLGNIFRHDIEINGIKETINFIKNNCTNK